MLLPYCAQLVLNIATSNKLYRHSCFADKNKRSAERAGQQFPSNESSKRPKPSYQYLLRSSVFPFCAIINASRTLGVLISSAIQLQIVPCGSACSTRSSHTLYQASTLSKRSIPLALKLATDASQTSRPTQCSMTTEKESKLPKSLEYEKSLEAVHDNPS